MLLILKRDFLLQTAGVPSPGALVVLAWDSKCASVSRSIARQAGHFLREYVADCGDQLRYTMMTLAYPAKHYICQLAKRLRGHSGTTKMLACLLQL